MPVRVFVLGRVATADLSASHAHPEVEPRVTEGYALLTASRVRLDVADYLVEVIAELLHVCP
jgi:hypothetical protein